MPEGKEAEARAFYVEVLGFIEIAKPPELAKRGGAWFRSRDVVLHLGVDPDFRPARKAHPAFRCADYANTIERLATFACDVTPDALPFDGKAHCYLDDLFGNRLELIAD